MKKKIWIVLIIFALLLAGIFLGVYLKTRTAEPIPELTSPTEYVEKDRHSSGEWKDGLSVIVRYGDFQEAFGIYVVDRSSNWRLEKADDALYELTERAGAGNGSGILFELVAKQAGSGTLVLTNERKTLTIALRTDEKGIFELSGVTEEEKKSSNADKDGYDTLVEKFLPGGIPDTVEVAVIDLEDEEEGKITILLNYQESSMWYRIRKEDAQPVEGEETEKAEVVLGEIVTDNGWSTINWKKDGMLHTLEAEEGQEEPLQALHHLLTE